MSRSASSGRPWGRRAAARTEVSLGPSAGGGAYEPVEGGNEKSNEWLVANRSKIWIGYSGVLIFLLAAAVCITQWARAIYDVVVTSSDWPSLGYQATAWNAVNFYGISWGAAALIFRCIPAFAPTLWEMVTDDLLNHRFDLFVLDSLFFVAVPIHYSLVQAGLTNALFTVTASVLGWAAICFLLNAHEMNVANVGVKDTGAGTAHWTAYVLAVLFTLWTIVIVMGYGISQSIVMGMTARQAMLITMFVVITVALLAFLVVSFFRVYDVQAKDGLSAHFRLTHHFVRHYIFWTTVMGLLGLCILMCRSFYFV